MVKIGHVETDGVTAPVEGDYPGDPGSDGRSILQSILFPVGLEALRKEQAEQPVCFVDLNLDQVVTDIVGKRDEGVLRPLLYSTYRNEQIIRYRQAVFIDLERHDVHLVISRFCEHMSEVRLNLTYAERISYKRHREMVILRAIGTYVETIKALLHGLESLDFHSAGLCNLRQHLITYVSAQPFVALASETDQMRTKLSAIKYGMLFRGDKVTVRKYASEPDSTAGVLEKFARFREEDVEQTVSEQQNNFSLNHIEAGILELVGLLFPDVFRSLPDYVGQHVRFIDQTIELFDREVDFYLAYLAYIAPLKKTGLRFCYPEVSASDKETSVTQSFDLALGATLLREQTPIICNSFHLAGKERMLVVSGPNQGGKTTFARMFGQLHFLAGLGCPVPGHHARLFLADQLFTHFEREEAIENLRGKLEDELVRLRESCRAMTANSVIVLNEIFNSTSLEDQFFLSKKILEKILETDMLAVCVTFIDTLASMSEKSVSMVSTVIPDDPARRTFEIVRKPADGLAYALSLAQKRGVTYEQLRVRVRP
jgi:DNA mismatch repair protein MutS